MAAIDPAPEARSMRKTLLLAALLISTLHSFAFAADPATPAEGGVALPSSARSSVKIYALPGLTNVGRVAHDVFRGAQPADAGYETLKRMGIRTVVNLRTTESERR